MAATRQYGIEKMTTTVKQIFNYISGMNPTVNTISSLGSYVSNLDRTVADGIVAEVIDALNENTLAYKIATTADRYTEKQLWVIAYELEKNDTFVQKVNDFYARINRKAEAKAAASRQKLADNKANSQSVLDYVKSNGRLLGDYYKFVKGSKQYKKEFFSKKYTMESANAFLSL